MEERARFQVRDLGIVCAVAGAVTSENLKIGHASH